MTCRGGVQPPPRPDVLGSQEHLLRESVNQQLYLSDTRGGGIRLPVSPSLSSLHKKCKEGRATCTTQGIPIIVPEPTTHTSYFQLAVVLTAPNITRCDPPHSNFQIQCQCQCQQQLTRKKPSRDVFISILTLCVTRMHTYPCPLPPSLSLPLCRPFLLFTAVRFPFPRSKAS